MAKKMQAEPVVPATVPMKQFEELQAKYNALVKAGPVSKGEHDALLERVEQLERKMLGVSYDVLDEVREIVDNKIGEHRREYSHDSNSHW